MASVQFNYIISGMGCAGLSLAMHLVADNRFAQKTILLIDKDAKQTNDRTWCFWETTPGLFEPIVHRRWKELWYCSPSLQKKLDIHPFTYKMIRGIDYYNHCLAELKKHPNVTMRFAEVDRLLTGAQPGIVTGGETIYANYVFNSILFSRPALKSKQSWLLQHFKGWVIETPQPAFTPGIAKLMDFRMSQEHGATFCYVMPFSTHQALVEYTLFSPALLEDEAYDKGLLLYLTAELGIHHFQVLETEFGVIPMTDYRFPVADGNCIYIGTAGGRTKGSSGYTFKAVQEHSKAIVDRLATGRKPVVKPSARFAFYDKVFLDVLANNRMPGEQIFTELFKKNNPATVLRFLANRSSLRQELGIVTSLPTRPFLRAALHQLL